MVAFTTMLVVFSSVVVAVLVAAALQMGSLALRRAGRGSSSLIADIVALTASVVGGVVFLWNALWFAYGPGGWVQELPYSLQIGAVFLYLAGCVGLMNVQSVLSRGYTLRILVDLLERGGRANVDSLKSGYGGGLGIGGLIAKRLHSLASLGLLHFQDNQVGPLTPLGKLLAEMTVRLRKLLRLEMVG